MSACYKVESNIKSYGLAKSRDELNKLGYDFIIKLDWYPIYYKSTGDFLTISYNNALLFFSEKDANSYINKYADKDNLIVGNKMINENKIDLLLNLGFNGIEFILEGKLEIISFGFLRIDGETKLVKSVPTINDFLELSILSSNSNFDLFDYKLKENKVFSDLLNSSFYLKYTIFEGREYLEQLIDKSSKTIWLSCYTNTPKTSGRWKYREIMFSDLIFHIKNCNGVTINPYINNIKVDNNFISDFKAYRLKLKAISLIFSNKHIKEIYNLGIDKLGKLANIFSRYEEIKLVKFMGLESNSLIEDNLIFTLELTSVDSLNVGVLNQQIQKLFKEKVFILKAWDLDPLYMKGAMVIFDRFS